MRILGVVLMLAVSSLLAFSGASADPLPKGFEDHRLNPANQHPVTEAGVTTFHLAPGVCSDVDYGDGRGEHDCLNGNLRSAMAYSTQATLGQAIEYRFDIRVDPSLKYEGFHSMSAAGFYPEGIDSALVLASWEGPFVHNFIYAVKASARHGIEFLANQCQAPEELGEWITFSMKIQWTNDTKGWVKVSCDDRVIYADEGLATNQAPFCWESNQCEPSIPKDPSKFLFILGPRLQGFGPDWPKIPAAKSLFAEIQDDGITVQVRNASVAKGALLYDEADRATIKSLQERLADLGCDPGPADGISGKKTREAALTCREFSEGVLPKKLTVATAQTFLDLYSAPEAAALPVGHLDDPAAAGLVPTQFVVHAGEYGAMKAGKEVEANSNITAKIEGWKKGQDEIEFIILGMFDYTRGNFLKLEFILQDSVGNQVPKAPKGCYVPYYITFPDGSVHASLPMQIKRATPLAIVAPKNVDCLIAALPDHQAKQMSFIIDHFADIAVGMVRDGTIDQVRHEGVKTFMQRVAMGELTVGRTPAQ